MASIGLFPDDDEKVTSSGMFLTFIASTFQICGLACAYCIVKQRDEDCAAVLRPGDFVRFIGEIAGKSRLYALGMQGHEPLAPASRPYTEAVLEAALRLGRPATLVSNGLYLREAAPWLADLRPAKVGISLDSPAGAIHDNFRRVNGAWATTVHGIKHVLRAHSGGIRLAVTSVLMPSDRGNLKDMPSLLQGLGVTDWIVTPLLRVGRGAAGGPVSDSQEVFDRMLVLQEAADRANIRLTLDDELDCLKYEAALESRPELKAIRIRRIPNGVQLYRVGPDGHCSGGSDILTQEQRSERRWRPGAMDASSFLRTAPYPGNSLAVTTARRYQRSAVEAYL